MIITHADITAHFSPHCFNKRWQLFTQGRGTAPNIQRGGELITALDRSPRAPDTDIPQLDGPQSASLLEAILASG